MADRRFLRLVAALVALLVVLAVLSLMVGPAGLSAKAAIAGLVVGLPLGTIGGSALWRSFASGLGVVPSETLPLAGIGIVIVARTLDFSFDRQPRKTDSLGIRVGADL